MNGRARHYRIIWREPVLGSAALICLAGLQGSAGRSFPIYLFNTLTRAPNLHNNDPITQSLGRKYVNI